MHKLIILFFIFSITISCSNNKVVKNHGISALELKSKKIKILNTNKNDAMSLLGKPSVISMFDESIWYFIQREKINQSVVKLGNQVISKNVVLEIKFNSFGIVESKKIYSLEDMQNLKIAKDQTLKSYDKKSKTDKLFNSLIQKIEAPKRNRRR